MRHDECGGAGQHPPERLLDLRLGLHVQRRQGIVEHEHPRTSEHGAGEREALPLPTGQRQALLADARGQPERQVVDEAGLRHFDGLGDVVVGDTGASQCQVLFDARGEQRRLLERGGDDAAQLVQRQVAHVALADGDRSARDVVQPRHQRGERRLARAGRADERHGLPVADLQVDAVQDVGGRVRVAKPHVVKAHGGIAGARVADRGIEDRRFGVEHLEDPPRCTCRLFGEREQPAQRDDGPDQPQVQGQECDELPQRHRVVRRREHAAARHAREDELRLALERGPELGQRVDLGQLGVAQHARIAGERRQHLRTPPVGLDHPDAERGLLDRRGEVTGEILRAARVAAVTQLEAPGEHGQRRDGRDDEQPEQQMDVQQQAEHDQGRRRVGDQEDEAETDESPDRRQVGGGTRQQLTRGPPVMERDRQPLQVREEVVADVALQPERGACHGVAAHEEEHGLGDAEQQCQPGKRPDGGGVVVADRAVDDTAGDQRDQRLGEHRPARRDDHDNDRFAVWPGPSAQAHEGFDSARAGVVRYVVPPGHVASRYDPGTTLHEWFSRRRTGSTPSHDDLVQTRR